VLGQSGKMTLSNGGNQVTITMDYIKELDAGGRPIGTSGPLAGKHGLNSFAPVAFDVHDVPYRTSAFGVPADGIDFNTTLVNDQSPLKVSTYVFLHDGTIHPTANESWSVGGGTIKFSIQIDTWPFCSGTPGNPCQNAVGAYLEFGLEIKGSADRALPTGEKRLTLATNAATGNNVTLELSDEVLIDGLWVRMPAGYPQVDDLASKFAFRLPRFATSAVYDPVVHGLADGSADEPTPQESSQGIVSVILAAAAAAGGSFVICAVLWRFGCLCNTTLEGEGRQVKANGMHDIRAMRTQVTKESPSISSTPRGHGAVI